MGGEEYNKDTFFLLYHKRRSRIPSKYRLKVNDAQFGW